jgi:hypothetical protein
MSKALLILIVSIFLVLIGGGIWKRTHMAVAPPIYDPITYYMESRACLERSRKRRSTWHSERTIGCTAFGNGFGSLSIWFYSFYP